MSLLIRIPGDFQPRAPAYAVRIHVTWTRSWTQNLLESTLRPTAKPFAQYDWPTPKDYLRVTPFWATNLLETTLAPEPPILLSRGPLYAAKVPFTWYRDWSQNLVIRQVTAVPFKQTEWP